MHFDIVKLFLTALLPLIFAANAAKKKRQDQAAPPARQDVDEAERTRRVQDEVRRKIEARRQGAAPLETEEASEPPPPASLPDILPLDPFGRAAGRRGFSTPAPVSDEAAQARRRRLAAQIEQAEAARAAADRRAAEWAQASLASASAAAGAAGSGAGLGAAGYSPPPPAISSSAAVSPWLAELREPANARRAIVLREILGAPVALR